MGKGKTSRKGKKQWRKNIGTEEQDAYIAEVAKDARSGGPVHQLKDEQIFFVDKAKAAVSERKIYKARKKVLRCDSVLQRNSLIPPITVAASIKKKQEPKKKTILRQKSSSVAPLADKSDSKIAAAPTANNSTAKEPNQNRKRKGEQPLDLWDNGLSKDNDDMEAEDEETEQKDICSGGTDVPADQKKKKKRKKKAKPALPGVEVCLPGCSYNPTFNDHQDALGEAVAQEMKAIYEQEMQPEPIPMKVVDVIEEDYGDLSYLQIDGNAGENGEDRGNNESSSEEQPDASVPSRAVKVKKLTRTDLNRRARRRAQEMLEKAKKHWKKMRKDVMRLPELMEDLKKETEEKERKRIRMQVSRAERIAEGPPRLGKHKFQQAAVQVMTSEELTGSMRTLKGCFTLLRDRYKSLQKRGLVEPRVKLGWKQPKKRKEYEAGSRGRREKMMHAERMAEKKLAKTGGVVKIVM